MEKLVESQRNYFNTHQTFDLDFRIKQLKRLKQSIKLNMPKLIDAFMQDLNKTEYDLYLTELFIVNSEINHMIKHLRKWSKPRKTGVDIINVFGKGKIGEPDRDYIRLFTGVTRQLYKSCETTSEHAYLSYFFRMIPFVNRQTNILCRSQQEQDREHIAYMTTTEFFNLIGRTHHGRIKTQLQTYRIDGELLVGFFDTLDSLIPQGEHAIINPILYYGGDRTKQNYADIRKLFTDEKETYLSSQT